MRLCLPSALVLPRLSAAFVLMSLSAPTLAAGHASTSVQTSTRVPVDQDGCLDHAVKELGMSATRVEQERKQLETWLDGARVTARFRTPLEKEIETS